MVRKNSMSKNALRFTLAAMLFALSFPAQAQQTKKFFRIGYFSSVSPTNDAVSEPFRLALRESGYIEGQNIVIEYRYRGERKQNRDPELVADLVRLKVDLIVVAGGTTPIRAAMNATKTIPIVMVGAG